MHAKSSNFDEFSKSCYTRAKKPPTTDIYMADDKKAGVKQRKPTALKRDGQSEKKRLHNKQFKSSVKTAIRILEASIKTKDNIQEKLSTVFSLMDKGVKTGVFKANKADRTKSRLTSKVASA